MRSVSFLAAAVIKVSALTAACGQQKAGSAAGGPSGSPAPSTGHPAAAACGSDTPTQPPNRILTLNDGDSGSSFCIKRGTRGLIYLTGTPTAELTTLKSSPSAMQP